MRNIALNLILFLVTGFSGISVTPAADCPSSVPVQGAPPSQTLPLLPRDNWWNLDISNAPVDADSAALIAFIANGGNRRLHPDFGGEETPGGRSIYGMPYAVVDGSQPKKAVSFLYGDESDGVDVNTGQSLPFYPIPAQATTQAHWIEGGAPGNIDQRSSSDRHLLIIDCTHNHLYELYNVYYNASQARWFAGSGAFFDLNANERRPDGWTSADAAGLAILPGLVRYDEVYGPDDIAHALRVTVRASNGYVYPASHRAGSTSGALPMGARLRLKASVEGRDPALRTDDPAMQKIFRAMQRYGLIVADNGSDLYITGTFDTRWDNDILNPAFALLGASDFEVVQQGWNPLSNEPAALRSLSVNPNTLASGGSATGTVQLTAPAPEGGSTIALASAANAFSVPAGITVAQGIDSAAFPIATSTVGVATSGTLSASYNGVTKTTTLTAVPPPTLKKLTLTRSRIRGGKTVTGKITLAVAPTADGATVTLSSSNTSAATVPSTVTIPQGAVSASFSVATQPLEKKTSTTISAAYAGSSKSAVLTVTRR